MTGEGASHDARGGRAPHFSIVMARVWRKTQRFPTSLCSGVPGLVPVDRKDQPLDGLGLKADFKALLRIIRQRPCADGRAVAEDQHAGDDLVQVVRTVEEQNAVDGLGRGPGQANHRGVSLPPAGPLMLDVIRISPDNAINGAARAVVRVRRTDRHLGVAGDVRGRVEHDRAECPHRA